MLCARSCANVWRHTATWGYGAFSPRVSTYLVKECYLWSGHLGTEARLNGFWNALAILDAWSCLGTPLEVKWIPLSEHPLQQVTMAPYKLKYPFLLVLMLQATKVISPGKGNSSRLVSNCFKITWSWERCRPNTEENLCGDVGRDWSGGLQAKVCLGLLTTWRDPQGTIEQIFPLSTLKKSACASTLILDFQAPDVCCHKPLMF